MISHHPAPDLLLDYATGAQHEPVALLVATHLALCPACRDIVLRMEDVGGDLISGLEPMDLSADAADRALALIDAQKSDDVHASAAGHPAARQSEEETAALPQPLRGYVDDARHALRWRSLGSVAEAALLERSPGFRTRLMRIRAGAVMPRHTHGGSELTLVLAGGFTDSGDHFLRGDVAAADPSVDHQPMADAGEDCLCLAVTDAPLRMTGPLGRHLNFLVRRWM